MSQETEGFDFFAWWNGLPLYLKVILVIITIFILIKLFNAFNEIRFNAKKTTALAGYAAQGEKANYPNSEYKLMADQLETAMRGFGTNENQIYHVMNRLKNNVDAVKLNKAFGLRSSMAVAYSLREWLVSDLTLAEQAKIAQILDFNGITYRFK